MTDYFFLGEKNYENVMHSYKSLKPKTVTNSFIDFDFPDGDYFVDSINLSIKFDGKIIPKNNLSIEDFISEIVPYYDFNIYNNPANERPIAAQFVSAYGDICKLNTKKKLCFTIPLLRLVSMHTNINDYCYRYQYTKSAHLRLVKQKINPTDSISIFKYMSDVDLTNLPDEIMKSVTEYAESKIEYEIFYRETKFFNMGKIVPPDTVDFYSLDNFVIEFKNQKNKTIRINDKNNNYNYKNMLIVVDMESALEPEETIDQPDNNYIDEIELCMNIKNICSKSHHNIFKITKEQAEIFNISYQVGSKYYLVDISKFIDSRVKSQVNNYYETYENKSDRNASTEEKYQERLDVFRKDIQEYKEMEQNKRINFELELSVTLHEADTGFLNVYLF